MAQLPERIVEVRVGPAGGQALEWRNPLYIEATIKPTLGRHPNKATVKLYNLGDSSIAWIKQKDQVIYVLAGEGTPGQVFAGDIDTGHVVTKPSGDDIVTEVEAADGRRKFREAMFVASYPPGTSRDTILPDVFVAFGLPTGSIATLPPLTYPAGVAFAQRARDVLDELLGQDAYWSIQSGSLQIIKANEALSGNSVLLDAESGLIDSPEKKDNGVDFKCEFNRQLRPGGGVRIESDFFTGDLKVTKLKHDIASDGLKWETAGTGVPV